MSRVINRTGALLLGMSLGLGLSLPASGQDATVNAVTVRVKPGKLDDYLRRVKKLQESMQRLEGKGTIEVWQVTAGGPATGNTLVAVEYPSLVDYAESTTKTQGDAEFQKQFGGLDDVRTVQSTGLYRQISGPGREGDTATGSALQSVVVQVKPGRVDDYLAKIEQLRKISERLGTSSTMRVFQAAVAGEATGTVVIGVTYEDLATYAADSTKTQGDPEWQKVIGGLDDMRTIVSTSLARNVGP